MSDVENKWRVNKQINLSVLVQLVFLASLIIGTWVNLQRQLCLLREDMDRLIKCQEKFSQRIEILNEQCIGFEYRLSCKVQCPLKRDTLHALMHIFRGSSNNHRGDGAPPSLQDSIGGPFCSTQWLLRCGPSCNGDTRDFPKRGGD